MTDEEIEKEAKEYAQGNFYSEQGFLYGYERGFTEGKPKWHDLRKDPNDLPKYKNSSVNRVCWINEYGNKCYHDAFYDDKGFYWVSEKTCIKRYPVINVIAWVELSEFEE